MTVNLYLMGESSNSSNGLLKVFTGTDPKISLADNLNDFTANLILNIAPQSFDTHLHQKCNHRGTALILTTHDGTAQKNVFQLYQQKEQIETFHTTTLKNVWFRKNKHYQTVLCDKICRLANKTILAVISSSHLHPSRSRPGAIVMTLSNH